MSIKEHTREIWYISDLHFDYAKNLTIYRARLNNFFNLVTSHPNVIFVLAGNFLIVTKKLLHSLIDWRQTT